MDMTLTLTPSQPITITTGSSTSGPPGPQGATGPAGPVGPRGPAGEDGALVTTDGQSITIATPPLPTLSKHIIRRALGSSDCPLVEANVAEQSVTNAAILKAAFEAYGHLTAGPNGAVYDMGYCAPNMFAKPMLCLEGNGSQTFRGLAEIFNNNRNGGSTQYLAGGTMFAFKGIITGADTPAVAITFGNKASIRGINIVGPLDDNPGWVSLNNAIAALYIDELNAEGLEISGWSLGALISLTVVKNGGSLCGNTLHNCEYTNYQNGIQMTGIEVDRYAPNTGELRGSPLPGTPPWGVYIANFKAWTGMGDGHVNGVIPGGSFALMDTGIQNPAGRPTVMNDNKIFDLRVPDAANPLNPQTDGINTHMFGQNLQIHGGFFSDLGDGLDLNSHGVEVSGLKIQRCFNGLKLVYAFRDALVSGCNISDIASGGNGINVGASGHTGLETKNINLDNNVIRRVGEGGSCIEVEYNAASQFGAVEHLYVTNNTLDPVNNAYWLNDGAEGNNHHYLRNIGIDRGQVRHQAVVNTRATNGSYIAHDDVFLQPDIQ